jgi:hypothetical protein
VPSVSYLTFAFTLLAVLRRAFLAAFRAAFFALLSAFASLRDDLLPIRGPGQSVNLGVSFLVIGPS